MIKKFHTVDFLLEISNGDNVHYYSTLLHNAQEEKIRIQFTGTLTNVMIAAP